MSKSRILKISNIRKNHDMIAGTRKQIEERLRISHSPHYVHELMDMVDLIIELSTEMGIDISKCGFDEHVKTNIYRAREMRK